MPLNDCSKLDHGFFQDFHNDRLGPIKHVVNDGLKPNGFYAMTDHHFEGYILDVATCMTRRDSLTSQSTRLTRSPITRCTGS